MEARTARLKEWMDNMRAIEFLIETKVEEDNLYKIPQVNWWVLQDNIEKLNKRGAKIGAPPIIINIEREEIEHVNRPTPVDARNMVEKRYYIVSLKGEAPKIAGWHLVASLDYVNGEVIANVIPNETMPTEFRNTTPARCDHCNSKRDRKNSFIVQHDSGEYKQVGRSCLKNFLGHKDPKMILWMAEIIRDVYSDLEDAEKESWGSNREPERHHIKTFLAFVSICVRKDGWVPKSAAFENTATAYWAFENMYPSKDFKKTNGHDPYEPTDKDYELAESALTWVRDTIGGKTSRTDYEHNIVALTKDDWFFSKHSGYVASVVTAYQRWKDNEVKYAERKKRKSELAAESDYVGEVGIRFGAKKVEPLELQFQTVRWVESHFGSTGIHKFVDRNGNYFVWFASVDPELDQESWYKFAGTVKKHEEDKYNSDAKTTYLTRMKMLQKLEDK